MVQCVCVLRVAEGQGHGTVPRVHCVCVVQEFLLVTRREFVQLCVSALLERDMEELKMAAETFAAAQSIRANRARKSWRKVSK